MASVHKHSSGRSTYYYASYLGEDGRWKLRSTKKTRYSEAMEVAIEFERAAKMGRAGTLTITQCRKVLSDMLERVSGDKVEHKTTEDFCKDWLENKATTKSESTAARYEGVLKMFKTHLGPKVGLNISAITPRDVQTFLNKRLKSGCSTKTVSVDRKSLSSVFSSAHKQGLILVNPVIATEIPTVKSQQRDCFTAAQVGLLLDAADTIAAETATARPEKALDARRSADDWKTAILLGYFIGARLGDCANMQWDSVDLGNGTIKYVQAKTDEEIKVPIHTELEQWLHKRAGSDTPEKFLCPTLAGRESGGAHGLSLGFAKLMEKAGIDPGKVEGGKKVFSKLSFHSLRHSFNSALANANVDQELRMRLTGHKSADVNRIYTHHEHKALKRAVKKLPGVKS